LEERTNIGKTSPASDKNIQAGDITLIWTQV